jgi:hypothetical protein
MSNISLAQTSEEGTVWWGVCAFGNLILDQSYRSKGTLLITDTQKVFLGTRYSMLCEFCYFFAWPDSCTVKNMCIYANTWFRRRCIWVTIAFKWYSQWNIFTINGRDGKSWLGICHWDAVLPVSERLRDSGQEVSQSPCQTGRNSSTNYFQILRIT